MNDDIVKESQQPKTPAPANTEDKYKKQSEEYLEGWKRAKADFINYKKDEAKRMEEFFKFANAGTVLEVIDLLDDLETAAKEIKNPGLDQVLKKFQEFLKKYEVERIPVEKFDPAMHEAVSTEPGGEKIEEVRAGYTMHERVIRPSRIKIIK